MKGASGKVVLPALLPGRAEFGGVVTNLAREAEAHGAVIKRSSPVTREVLEQAPKLRVIGRAGVGVDNVDLPAATAAGV